MRPPHITRHNNPFSVRGFGWTDMSTDAHFTSLLVASNGDSKSVIERRAVGHPADLSHDIKAAEADHLLQPPELRGKVTSTRRFFLRPSSVLLSAMG